MSNDAPAARFELLIRRPAADVFGAFVEPDTATKFWFTRSTGRLEKGATVRWFFGEKASCEVHVLELEADRRIRIEWAADGQEATSVEWTFEARSADTTYVRVEHAGFQGDPDEIVRATLDSTGGFALVLAAAKAYLEHGVQLHIIEDRF